ncbi:MAG: tetratricopeptide (TPR) repeat protein, partial [Myxococcota bacterium]
MHVIEAVQLSSARRHITSMPPRVTSLRRHGLRVTVRLYGMTQSQTVHWPSRGSVLVGVGLDDAIPTTSGGALLSARWGPKGVHLNLLEPDVPSCHLSLGEEWSWNNKAGVEVSLDLVPAIHASRAPQDAYGDVALLTMVLMLLVGVGQVQMLVANLYSGLSGAPATTFEPTPEMIARLMEEDYDGADKAVPERADRREFTTSTESFHLPAGNDGPTQRAGGGENMGEEIKREEEQRQRGKAEAIQIPADADALADNVLAPEPLPDMMLDQRSGEQLILETGQPAVAELDPGDEGFNDLSAPSPMERFVGWGFRDWFDVRDARRASVEELEWNMEQVRQRLRIDPDDSWALNTLGLYAYLAENDELSQDSFERYIDLYPEDPLGYNNLALTYKRAGDYTQEESLYHKALELDEDDVHVLNNLAVNLAHQHRFDEALEIMESLETIDPGNPYNDLHRSKIYAAMGKREKSYRHLKAALEGVSGLDTLHHIEFR